MAEEEKNAEEVTEEEKDSKKKSNSNIGLLIGVIVGVIILQAGIAFAIIKLTAPKTDESAVTDSTSSDTTKSNDISNVTVENEQFTPNPFTVVVNIAGTDGMRFLKATIQLAYDADNERNKEFGAKYLNYEIPIKNYINQYLSSLTLAEVQDKNAQLNIRRDLLRGINKLFPPNTGEISNVYITEYIIQ